MRIKLTVSYDGSEFCGWQRQKNGVSVQETLENALYSLTGEKIKATASGRTDAGVHAAGQVVHFDTQSKIPPPKFYKALNVLLPDSVKVLKSEEAPQSFNAVKSAKKKTYRYSLYNSEVPLPLKERYAYRIFGNFDVEKMKAAASVIEGTHDFKCFSATGGSVKTTTRTVYNITVQENGEDIEVTVTGNGFLYNMVRIIAGTLIAAGQGDITETDIKKAFETNARNLLGKTLPAKGLCLLNVEYT